MTAAETIRLSLMEIDRHRDIIAQQLGLIERMAEYQAALQCAPARDFTLAEIAFVVCSVFNVSLEDFTSSARPAAVCDARKAFYLLARELTNRSSGEIAKHVGGRDHGTALFGIKAAKDRVSVDSNFLGKVNLVRQTLARTSSPKAA